MVKKSTKSTTAKKPTKKASTAKKVSKKNAVKSNKVDYYPNRVPFLVAVAAVMILFTFALITAL